MKKKLLLGGVIILILLSLSILLLYYLYANSYYTNNWINGKASNQHYCTCYGILGDHSSLGAECFGFEMCRDDLPMPLGTPSLNR